MQITLIKCGIIGIITDNLYFKRSLFINPVFLPLVVLR